MERLGGGIVSLVNWGPAGSQGLDHVFFSLPNALSFPLSHPSSWMGTPFELSLWTWRGGMLGIGAVCLWAEPQGRSVAELTGLPRQSSVALGFLREMLPAVVAERLAMEHMCCHWTGSEDSA